jgi:hypothetical protein
LFTKKWERDSQKNEVEAIKEVVALTGDEEVISMTILLICSNRRYLMHYSFTTL